MVEHPPIYQFQQPRTSARNRSIFGCISLLLFVALSSVFWLSFGDSLSWKQWRLPAHTSSLFPQSQQQQPQASTAEVLIDHTSSSSNMTGSAATAENGDTPPLLNDFLVQTKANAIQHLKQSASSTTSQQKLTIIMGNEAGDLDSASCAIALSYLLTFFGSPTGYTLPASSYVPLIQSEHADDVLRPENTAAYRAAGIDPQSLFCLDDVRKGLGLSLDSSAFAPSYNVAFGLVDHPSLGSSWRGAQASDRDVEIIVDHHEDNGDHQDAKLRIVKSPTKDPVGSASSLIANLFADQLAKAPPSTGLRQVADLLISAIIIDTDNLRPIPRGKASQVDFEAVKLLFPHSSFSDPSTSDLIRQTAHKFSPQNSTSLDTASVKPIPPISPSEDIDSATHSAKLVLQSYWWILLQSKLAVSHLSGRDLLRRDYKEKDFPEEQQGESSNTQLRLKLGFSSVPISIVEWLHKDRPIRQLSAAENAEKEVEEAWKAWWEVLDEFMAEKGIDIAVMTGSFHVAEGEVDAGKHKREMVIAFAPRPQTHLIESKAQFLWDELRKGLETDAHVSSPDQVERRLMLEQPWKGQRLPESAGGKKERVKGIDHDGRRINNTSHSNNPNADLRWAKVYKQANARANRKIVLPAVMSILKTAVSKL